ncbi:MAG TPA: heat-inducible transcriptional repressor HrcA [Terriglobales bacterium]|nr:heat-inducible transcriptional repressor HrcA [Terriglobales bacterium]
MEPNRPTVGPREREILTAIVETYIATGEPVGSRTLSRAHKDGLSSATIRNVMADLADAGFLEQPHTSAGRVPTTQAYRYYVEQISGKAHIKPADQGLIEQSLGGISDPQEFMERTSRVLSLISSGVGVAMAGSGPSNALDHIHFSRLAEKKILGVVVTKGGVVRDRVFRVEHDLAQNDLDTAARYLNENFRGWTMESIRKDLSRRLEQERSEYDRLMQSVKELYQGGALGGESGRVVFVEGVANLVVNEEDRDRLRQLLRTLEEKQRVIELLSAYVDERQEAVRVVIGLEDALPEMRNFVLIGAPARVGQEMMGSLAVIGPTRMDYEHTITAVSYIAQLFDKILNEPE